MISKEQINMLLEIPELWEMATVRPLDQVIEYYDKFFITPMKNYVDIDEAVLCDCSAGLGWLSFAFLLRGGKAAVLVEPDKVKIHIAREIGDILGVADKCTFLDCYMQDIPLADNSVDIFASIETLEHVGAVNIDKCIRKMNSLTRTLVIVTAPNRLFPIDSHDTRLPFAHWLPRTLRRAYCSAFGKRIDLRLNHYPGPWNVLANLKNFRPISKALVFEDISAWRRAYPLLIPYQNGGYRSRPPRSQEIVLSLLSAVLGRYSFVATWNLSSMWMAKRNEAHN
jgi:hypothetical protein